MPSVSSPPPASAGSLLRWFGDDRHSHRTERDRGPGRVLLPPLSLAPAWVTPQWALTPPLCPQVAGGSSRTATPVPRSSWLLKQKKKKSLLSKPIEKVRLLLPFLQKKNLKSFKKQSLRSSMCRRCTKRCARPLLIVPEVLCGVSGSC